MEVINTPKAPAAIGPYIQAHKVNGIIYTSGQIPLDKNGELVAGGVKEQTERVLYNLRAVLEEGGSSMAKVIKTTVFIKDMNDFAIINTVYSEAFGDHKPARSCVEVARLPKDVLVEIECIAIV